MIKARISSFPSRILVHWSIYVFVLITEGLHKMQNEDKSCMTVDERWLNKFGGGGGWIVRNLE